MFMDDDVVVNNNTFSQMNKIISKHQNNRNIVGYGFNQIDKSHKGFEILKNVKIFSIFNLYPLGPGKVAKAGGIQKY